MSFGWIVAWSCLPVATHRRGRPRGEAAGGGRCATSAILVRASPPRLYPHQLNLFRLRLVPAVAPSSSSNRALLPFFASCCRFRRRPMVHVLWHVPNPLLRLRQHRLLLLKRNRHFFRAAGADLLQLTGEGRFSSRPAAWVAAAVKAMACVMAFSVGRCCRSASYLLFASPWRLLPSGGSVCLSGAYGRNGVCKAKHLGWCSVATMESGSVG